MARVKSTNAISTATAVNGNARKLAPPFECKESRFSAAFILVFDIIDSYRNNHSRIKLNETVQFFLNRDK